MSIGGFEIGIILVGIVQLAKKLGLVGRAVTGLALGLGLVLFCMGQALAQNLMPPAVALWAVIVIRSIGYTLAVPGLYDLLKDELLPAVARRQ